MKSPSHTEEPGTPKNWCQGPFSVPTRIPMMSLTDSEIMSLGIPG
jgi:hypothetical protein